MKAWPKAETCLSLYVAVEKVKAYFLGILLSLKETEMASLSSRQEEQHVGG